MNLLAFDTSASACSIALQCHDRVVFSHEITPLQQAKIILPRIQELLASCSLVLHELDAIAYGCGPGSFTGGRIASSVAQGLGFALQKPVIRVSSMAALAQAVLIGASSEQDGQTACTHVMVAVDARMEQIYWALYAKGKEDCVELIGREQVCSPKEIARYCSEEVFDRGNPSLRWCGAGDGWGKYEGELVQQLGFKPLALYPARLPCARGLLQLAIAQFQRQDWITATEAVPVYLR